MPDVSDLLARLRDDLDAAVRPGDFADVLARRRHRARAQVVTSAVALTAVGLAVGLVVGTSGGGKQTIQIGHRPPTSASPAPAPSTQGLPGRPLQGVSGVAFAGDPQHLVALSEHCTSRCTEVVHRSDDNGRTWQSGPTLTRFNSSADVCGTDPACGGAYSIVFAADGRHGWAYGPALFATSDGGEHWTKVPVADDVVNVAPAGDDYWVLEQSCPRDPAHCTNRILSATLGSAALTPLRPQPSLGTTRAWDLTRPDASTAYVLTWTKVWADSGGIWSARNPPCNLGQAGGSLVASGPTRVYLLCGRHLYESADSARHWTRLPDPPGNVASDTIVAGGALWLFNDEGIYRSNDLVTGWAPVRVPSRTGGVKSLTAWPDGQSAVVTVGGNDQVYTTTDGGQAWVDASRS